MKLEHAEEYTQALGQVVSGGWRQIALGEELGVPKALGLTTREWVEQRLGGYVRLSIEERREAVAELVAVGGLTQQQAGDVLGVDRSTVSRDIGANTPSTSNGSSGNAEADDPAGANAQTELLEQRIAQLDNDLAARVNAGTFSIDEAETVHAQNERRVDEWAKRVRDGLFVLTRMAGHPIPGGIENRLTPQEGSRLVAVLNALEPFKEGDAI